MKKIFSIIFILSSATAMAQNVGIGETAPTEMKLQVKRADSAVLLLQNSTTSGTDNKTGLFYKTGNYYSGSIATIGSGATFRMGLFTYGGSNPSSLKERITILDGGNVGVGTTNPGYVLDVNGRARFMYNGNTSGFWYNKADNTEAAFVGMVNDSTMGFFGNGTVGNWRMGFDVKNAKMGIGITNPSAPLSFASTVGNKIALWGDASGGHYGLGIQGSLMQLYSSASSADIAFGYGNSAAFTENMRIKGNGNVGIGTNNPTAKLEVAGTIKIADGTQGADKVLVSDAAGNGSWQNATNASGSVGYGTWGDCSTNGISEYNPVADPDGDNGDQLGNSVAISGNFAIAGSYADNVGANTAQGSVSFFSFNGTKWIVTQKISEATGAANDNFGNSVSISGNYAFVGIAGDDIGANTNQGSVNVYFYNGTSWVFTQKLTDAAGLANDYFGNSVSVSGNVAMVGSYLDDNGFVNNGSVSFYQLVLGSWIFKQKMVDNAPAAGDQFGSSVSISGNYAIVGVNGDDVGANVDQGSVSIFFNNGSNWVFTQKITDGSGVAGAVFGYSVSISGNYAVIGAPFDGSGGYAGQGSAHFYRYNGSTWVLMQKILEKTSFGDQFGYSVSISGDYAIIGAVQDNSAPSNEDGSATIYLRIGLGWQKQQKFFGPDGNNFDRLGEAVGIDGASKRFLVGVPYYGDFSGKVLFGKVN